MGRQGEAVAMTRSIWLSLALTACLARSASDEQPAATLAPAPVAQAPEALQTERDQEERSRQLTVEGDFVKAPGSAPARPARDTVNLPRKVAATAKEPEGPTRSWF